MKRLVFLLIPACGVALAPRAEADPFSYLPSGQLVSGSGRGRHDETVYAPGILFPIEEAPAFANSQVWGHGGSNGPGGTQCDPENFRYPWHDNFCETRSWNMPLCPAGTGHQGQDVRASTCQAGVHRVLAVTDGTITHIGSYTVYLTAADGTRFDYLHMDHVAVQVGQKVSRGDHVGNVSNQFGTSSTTVHLHFNIQQNVAGVGTVFVPPYKSLIAAYQTLIGGAAPDAGLIHDGGPSARDADPADTAQAEEDGSVSAPPPPAPAEDAGERAPPPNPSLSAPGRADKHGCTCVQPGLKDKGLGFLLALAMIAALKRRGASSSSPR